MPSVSDRRGTGYFFFKLSFALEVETDTDLVVWTGQFFITLKINLKIFVYIRFANIVDGAHLQGRRNLYAPRNADLSLGLFCD